MSSSNRHFNPRAPYGARPPCPPRHRPRCHDFNPRAPYGARPVPRALLSSPRIFQSTRPIRGATHHGQRLGREVPISIHAPHTGRDWRSSGDRLMTKISIHAPHTGRDVAVQESRYGVLLFQSTRPIRGATTVCNVSCFGRRDFNPRAPYGARLHFCTLCRFLVCISIHAPHTGRDLPRAK